ncbi:hypothetical protein VFPPC_17430 [Pochonia chlamydosporia 170]|uniref:Uncharacterized protein n=1 Tax=Pochonia chlamydosporia 170 TaxID=1380566 RepID=A0A219ARM1_METCM|nr:hypothetical protein VFPPC_17430 [Pochonia chlamydosporia 170]OWT43421.1 hypothetical protein VFPPC_17430 [Pochonia chlamydosporia 170]
MVHPGLCNQPDSDSLLLAHVTLLQCHAKSRVLSMPMDLSLAGAEVVRVVSSLDQRSA